MAETKSVGLLMITEVPNMGLCAVLQRRGEWNFEKNEPESWPGACQVTIHGKVEDGEDVEEALFREIREELGGEFADVWLFLYQINRTVRLFLASVTNAAKTFITKVPHKMISHIRLHAGSGGLLLVKESDIYLIRPLVSSDKHRRVANLAMFEDEFQALRALKGASLYFLTCESD